jgi:hypothetical protein
MSDPDNGAILDHHRTDGQSFFVVRLRRLKKRFAHEAFVAVSHSLGSM